MTTFEDPALAVAYAQNFWDAGNTIVTVMFALAFGVYFALIQITEARRIVSKYFWFAVAFAVPGNGFLAYVIFVLYRHEKTIVGLLTVDNRVLNALTSAFLIREGMLTFNFLMYLGILIFVRKKVGPIKELTSDKLE